MLRRSVAQVHGTVIGLRWLCNVDVIYFVRNLIADVIFEIFRNALMLVDCV